MSFRLVIFEYHSFFFVAHHVPSFKAFGLPVLWLRCRCSGALGDGAAAPDAWEAVMGRRGSAGPGWLGTDEK